MSEKKEPLTGLFRDNPATPEGKYLVKRRDGTVVEWPSFVLGARDPDAAETLLYYGLMKLMPPEVRKVWMESTQAAVDLWMASPRGQNKDFVRSVQGWAAKWEEYRKQHGDGDPLMGAHRKDDPATIAEMRKGMAS